MDPTYVPPEYVAGMPFGPLSAFIESYVVLVKEQGYLPGSVQHQVRLIVRFNHWLERTRRTARSLNATIVDQFFRRELRGRWLHSCDPATMQRLLAMLRRAGAVPPVEESGLQSPSQQLIDRFRRFLIDERALSSETVCSYVRYIGGFLADRFGAGRLNLSALRASDLTGYLQRNATYRSPDWTRILVAALRSFLRYLRYQGLIEADLGAIVPSVATWSLSGLPKHLSADAVKRVLDRCERKTGAGRRNFAILLLMARLGLRAGEVMRLNLEDMDWVNAQITVHGKGRRWSRMPLPADVGRAVTQYLRCGRPRCSCRRVFIRDRAPHAGFTRSNAISYIAASALHNAGVKSARKGAHLFRHSLATTMLRNGASLEEIGQLLRHKSPDSTAIYAKVELTALRPLAMRWPGGLR